EGRILSAGEAYEKGLLSRVIKDEQVEDEAYASARRICQGAPLVAGWHKQWIRRLLDGRPLSDEEKAVSFAFLETEDYREGLAAFLEKRKPVFKAR
ncbi:MAG: enoyl-CoA hydratase/isomerase family protein, partial [Azonexus sp.]|nr:enoyl-CoA hydratase/isomerase family protein [Azonexus sp.]